MEHIVRISELTMDKLIRATLEAMRLPEKWQSTLTLTCGM